MNARSDRMMGLSLMLALVGSLSTVQAAERRAMHTGDVTITATSEENAPCADCPNGTGTKICYEVVLDADAENEFASDFHIKVSDGNANHYKCPEVCEVVTSDDGTETCQPRDGADGWDGFGKGSQLEGNPQVRQHYIGWWGPNDQSHPDDKVINKGEVWRICFVYCGPTTNLDNTIEWLLTDVPEDATPDEDIDNDGNRYDIPNRANGDAEDDPGWSGTKTTAAGSKVGFSLVACLLPDGTCRDDVAGFECMESDGEPQGDGSVCGEQGCIADLDGSGVVDAADLAELLGGWGLCEQCAADFNGDGVVNAADLALLLGSWGECPQSAVCGDGVVGEGEQCDPPDGATCDDSCQIITGACDYPDIRTIVSDADLDPPEIQQNYDSINATLHLFGRITFESFFFEPLDLVSSVALERVETLETCAGVPIDVAMVASALEQIMVVAAGLPLVEVITSVPGELEEVKAAIDELRMQGIGFPPVAETDFDAELKLMSILTLVDEAGVLEYGDFFFRDSSEVTEGQLFAITQANDEGGVLDFEVIDADNMVGRGIVRNNHCCDEGACEPGILDFDECDVMQGKWCSLPHAPPPANCALCSIGSKRCP